MRRLALICLAAASLSAPALAQPRPDEQRKSEAHATEAHKGPAKPAGESDRYGRWDAGWGARPPAPPKSFAKPSDWHRHVRACQQRYRTYSPRTDTYVVRPGVSRRCAL